MNDIFYLSKLIVKKKLNILNDSEKSQLKQFNEDYSFSKNIDFVKITQKISDYSRIDKDKAWKKLVVKAKIDKKKYILPIFKRVWFKYAAVAVILLGVSYFYQQEYFTKKSILTIPNENITLKINDDAIKVINEQGSTQIIDNEGNIVGTQNGNQLIYFKEHVKEKVVYNTLTVPYGKRFKIQLSDGTNVHLNSGTSLKYPVPFLDDEDRKVFLDGEAFFDVTKDTKRPFIITANEVDIRVLGTTFNVSSYPEDESINTVLIEGLVSIYDKNESFHSETAIFLEPGYKAAWNKTNKTITIYSADIKTHTAWIDGKLILNEVPLNDILKKLERQYNVVFKNNYKALENRKFTAKFDIENIYQVMESLSYSASFTYRFDENIITINP